MQKQIKDIAALILETSDDENLDIAIVSEKTGAICLSRAQWLSLAKIIAAHEDDIHSQTSDGNIVDIPEDAFVENTAFNSAPLWVYKAEDLKDKIIIADGKFCLDFIYFNEDGSTHEHYSSEMRCGYIIKQSGNVIGSLIVEESGQTYVKMGQNKVTRHPNMRSAIIKISSQLRGR